MALGLCVLVALPVALGKGPDGVAYAVPLAFADASDDAVTLAVNDAVTQFETAPVRVAEAEERPLELVEAETTSERVTHWVTLIRGEGETSAVREADTDGDTVGDVEAMGDGETKATVAVRLRVAPSVTVTEGDRTGVCESEAPPDGLAAGLTDTRTDADATVETDGRRGVRDTFVEAVGVTLAQMDAVTLRVTSAPLAVKLGDDDPWVESDAVTVCVRDTAGDALIELHAESLAVRAPLRDGDRVEDALLVTDCDTEGDLLRSVLTVMLGETLLVRVSAGEVVTVCETLSVAVTKRDAVVDTLFMREAV